MQTHLECSKNFETKFFGSPLQRKEEKHLATKFFSPLFFFSKTILVSNLGASLIVFKQSLPTYLNFLSL
jgi:hypothetical protein